MYTWSSVALGAYSPSEYSQVFIPYDFKRDSSRRSVIFCHGAGSDYKVGPVEKAIASAGFPLISTDLGGTYTWGSDTSLSRVTSAWNYMKANYGVASDKMILWGGSMGSLTSLLYAMDNPNSVAAISASLPIVDPEQVRAANIGGFQASIEAAIGSVIPNSKRPSMRPGDLTVPAKLYISSSDTVGSPALANTFVSDTGIESESLGAVGHSYNLLNTTSLVTFLLPYR